MLRKILCTFLNNLWAVLFDKHCLSDEKKCVEVESGSEGGGPSEAMSEDFIAEALRRTSKALQDIETLTSAATLT